MNSALAEKIYNVKINWNQSIYNSFIEETRVLCDDAKKWLIEHEQLSKKYILQAKTDLYNLASSIGYIQTMPSSSYQGAVKKLEEYKNKFETLKSHEWSKSHQLLQQGLKDINIVLENLNKILERNAETYRYSEKLDINGEIIKVSVKSEKKIDLLEIKF